MAKKPAASEKLDLGNTSEVRGPASVWKGMLTFGLISLPVRLHAGARAEHISFNQLHRICLSRIKQKLHCPACAIDIERADIVKGYEYQKDRYVVVEPEELDQCQPNSAENLDVKEFVQSAQIDPIYFESSYYITPQDGGQRAYGLLRAALIRTNRVGITQLVMHGREHIVVIRPYDQGLALHTLYYPEEMRPVAFPALDPGNTQEQKIAGELIEALSADFKPDQYTDGYAVGVKELIASRIAGKPVPKKLQPAKNVGKPLDIMDAMKASIAQANKKKKAA